MARLFILCVILLSLVGCGGGDFTASAVKPPALNNIAGMPNVGDAGETSDGGKDTLGGSAGAGSSSSQGGTGSTGGSPMGGSGGTGSAGTGGIQNQAGSAGSPPVMVCNPQDTQCSNGSFQTCESDGLGWTSQVCGFVCDAQMGCGGTCQPGTQQCDGADSQTCDKDGKWVTNTTCAFVCAGAGVCGGQCVPGTQQCSGKDAQLCDSKGAWKTSQTCSFTCNFTNNQASCGGTCTDGTHQCSGKVPQTCTSSEWVSGVQCPYLCTNGSCGGECVPGTQKCGPQGGIQTCSPQSMWLPEGNACPFTCTSGTCTGVCVPNAACGDDGNACTNDICNPQGTACLHPQKGNGAPCGSSSSSVCDNPDSCQAGICQPNPKASNTPCTDDGNACTNDMCNGAGTCQHPAAPATTVCRAASCSNGTVTSQATCGGSTSCPASTLTNCYGSCDPSGLMCLNPAPVKIDDVVGAPLAIDNDSLYVYASVRTSAGLSQILQYAKSNGSKTVLYQSSDTTDWVYSLIVSGTYLYFGETFWNPTLVSGQVSRISTSGSNQTATYVSNQATFGFAKNSTRIYWSDGTRDPCFCSSPVHHVYSVPIGGTVATTFGFPFNGSEVVPDIEVTDTNLYVWTMMPSGAPWVYKPVLKHYDLIDPLNNQSDLVPGYFIKPGNISAETRGNTPGLTKNGSFVFANVSSASDGVAFFSFKIVDDTQKFLGTSSSFTSSTGASLSADWDFVADDTNLYLGTVRLPIGGGSLSYWTNHEIANSTLSIDNSYLYFGSWGYWNDLPYTGTPDVQATALFKVAKP